MGNKEIFLGGFFMVLSVVVFALTFQFPQQTIALPPTIFPRFVSICLFLLALLLLMQGILGVRAYSASDNPASTFDKRGLARLFSLFMVAFVYTQILPHTGYVIATPPFVAGTMLLFHEKRWGWIVAISLGTSAILYLVFRMVFKIPLPRFNLW